VNGKIVSCGIVLLDPEGRVLLAHATGTNHWDIPKGQGEPGETESQSARREMVEETGIVVAASRLVDLGRYVYRRDKDLHLFAARAAADELDLSRCVCVSLFPRREDGVLVGKETGPWRGGEITSRIAPRRPAFNRASFCGPLFEAAIEH